MIDRGPAGHGKELPCQHILLNKLCGGKERKWQGGGIVKCRGGLKDRSGFRRRRRGGGWDEQIDLVVECMLVHNFVINRFAVAKARGICNDLAGRRLKAQCCRHFS